MGGGKGGGGEAKAAREDEQKRQQAIRDGTQRVNQIFDGRTVGDNRLAAGAAFDPTGKYYLEDGSLWSPTPQTAAPAAPPPDSLGTIYDPRGGARPQQGQQGQSTAPTLTGPTAQDQFAQMLSGGKLYGGTKKEAGFDDAFFTGRRQSFIDYATPQIEDQYGKAQRELTFALDRAGLLDSSARAQKAGELQQLYDLNKQQVADQALSYESEARTSVEDARSNLIATLNATGDAQGAANAALTRSQVLSKPASYSPLSNLFSDFTAGLGQQAALERASYYSGGQVSPRYNTGLFSPRPGAVKVS